MIDKYYCTDCEQTFNEPKLVKENHGFNDGMYEKFYVCPNCNSDGYVKAIQCDECERYIDDEYIQLKNGNNYCENCYNNKDIWKDI